MEGDGLRADGESFFFWLVSRTIGESRVGNCVGFNSGRFGLLDFILDGYFRVQICES